MTFSRLAVRTFEPGDQLRFAQLSGDHNPLHLDPILARREFFGEVLVHGIHASAWLMENWLAGRSPISKYKFAKLDATFSGPIGLGREVEARLVSESAGDDPSAVLEAWDGAQRVVRLEVALKPATRQIGLPESPAKPMREPQFVPLESISEEKGELELYLSPALAARDFPLLSRVLTKCSFAEFLAFSRLVGMVCPGERSIFSALKMCESDASTRTSLAYQVSRVVPSFSVVKLATEGPQTQGTIETFYRPQFHSQPSCEELSRKIPATAFKGQVALVIGGSRGIGEVTAKLVAAGGGNAIITYNHGHDDAVRVVADIHAAGGFARAIAMDVREPEPGVATLFEKDLVPTHIYYFASPKIFVKKPGTFHPPLFHDFASVYVHGLAATIEAMRARSKRDLILFYPSSTAIDELTRGLEEYVTAKAAGESLVAMIAARDPHLVAHVERLPRIATDQTTSLIPVPAKGAAEVMIPILQSLHRCRVGV